MTERYCEGERFADLSFTEEAFEDCDFTDCVFADCSFTKCELDPVSYTHLYHYYNEFLWPDRYADCVPMDKALELLKK